MRKTLVVVACFAMSGCAYYLTPRPPVMERKLGSPGNESIGALATAADYRVIYVRIKPGAKICAEPPPDAAGQFAAMIAASLSAPVKDKTISAETQASLALSMKQLFMRSQGVQHYRDGISALCNLYANDAITRDQYFAELQLLGTRAERLITIEIPYMNKMSFDPIATPSLIQPNKPNDKEDNDPPTDPPTDEDTEESTGVDSPTT